MFRSQTFLIAALAAGLAGNAYSAEFSGQSAYEFTRKAVEFGPRPPGTEANHKLQAYIIAQLRMDGCQIMEDAFTAQSPLAPVGMKNIIAKFPGTSGRAIAITGHFDTKSFPGRNFVGASDGGSSTGFLLELARLEAHQKHKDDLYIVFFDGEEAFGEWSETDSLYGSRHLADRWRKDGTLGKLKALINVDMIGDKNLGIQLETNSYQPLRRLVWAVAADLGYSAFFTNEAISEDDDHMPFVKAGAPAIDLIDIEYPPWHKDTDTMDKVSAKSLEIVGSVIVESIRRIEQQ